MILVLLFILAILLWLIASEFSLVGNPEEKAEILCPTCNQEINQTWLACPYCQERLKDTCPHCQKKKLIGHKYCPYCGHGSERGVS